MLKVIDKINNALFDECSKIGTTELLENMSDYEKVEAYVDVIAVQNCNHNHCRNCVREVFDKCKLEQLLFAYDKFKSEGESTTFVEIEAFRLEHNFEFCVNTYLEHLYDEVNDV